MMFAIPSELFHKGRSLRRVLLPCDQGEGFVSVRTLHQGPTCIELLGHLVFPN